MESKEQHIQYMSRAIALAQKGLGGASPNPLVGCVLVKDGVIIGEGWHKRYGGPHAEVNAVSSLEDRSQLIGATVYVTLEPCSHYGKTPPCADMLVSSKVGRVVIAHEDPHPLVDGRGVKKLKEAGIEVEVGMMRDVYAHVNRRFFRSIDRQRPYVILKWAETDDGFIARKNFDSKWISNIQARQLVHKWRAEEDAILVGTNTAKYDNPALTVRDWTGRHPTRVVIDPDLSLSQHLRLFDQSVKTYVVNTQKEETTGEVHWLKVSGDRLERDMLYHLRQRKVGSLIIEGGAKTLQRFIDLDLWDEARVFQAPTRFDEGIAAPHLVGNLKERMDVVGNTLSIYFNK